MSIADKFDELRQLIAANRPQEAVLIGKEALTLIRLRVQNRGENAEGDSFGTYSQAVVPFWFFDDIHNSAGARTRLEKEGYFVSYEDAREANNLQTDFKDFTFSGAMFRELGVEVEDSNNESTTVVIQSRTESGANKLQWNADRDGPILEVSDEELGMLETANKNRILRAFNEVFK